ncbi:unnamed protein product [Phaedon cochleariae]|uniref:FGGY carbohydrate kinase domain-containing protein n=1 Tax=Phaedon cochleariae TaxID=80249 RepID=A0A9N9SKX9_PHACE|nr:unnamed protein product [Phaedon cochleariae]
MMAASTCNAVGENPKCRKSFFVGVDVGTGSARAALVTDSGEIVKTCVQETKTWNDQPDFYEQSTEDIWNAVVKCVKSVVEDVSPEKVKGIGFDATCSLACFDKSNQPLTISPTGNNAQNVILWLDHRAVKEAAEINTLNHQVLQYVGGKISLEMETPKLMWLKKNLRKECWDKAGYFFDLPDFLTWRATDYDSRSSCSLVCKWTYEMSVDGTESWNKSYFEQIGLSELSDNNWKMIGSVVQAPGTPVGDGLSARAAKEFGLLVGTPVGTSMIDAHAGGLGVFGCNVPGIDSDFNTRIAIISGTSTCHMAVSSNPIFTPGVWGPYKNAMIPNMWLNEGGQSATGKLIDHVINNHPATPRIFEKIGDMHIQQYLNELLAGMSEKQNLPSLSFLTKDLHIWPDFHGNRSPIADPMMKGMVCGLTLASDEENLALLYLATVQALAYGTRHILESLYNTGYDKLKTLIFAGGLTKNIVLLQTHADACEKPAIFSDEAESVLLGAGILGASAAQYFTDTKTAIQLMGGKGKAIMPNEVDVKYHKRKYQVFLKMCQDQLEYRNMMQDIL